MCVAPCAPSPRLVDLFGGGRRKTDAGLYYVLYPLSCAKEAKHEPVADHVHVLTGTTLCVDGPVGVSLLLFSTCISVGWGDALEISRD